MTLDLLIDDNLNQTLPENTQGIKRLLLVEDNLEDREQLVEFICRACAPVLVEAVATGEHTMNCLAMHQIDCIILDYRLEAEDGLDVMSRVKERYPFCPVIILTGQGNESLAATSIKSGAADYLVKNEMSAVHLSKTVDNAITRAALELKIADQEQERDSFLRTLVHDLRAPLRMINQLGTAALEESCIGNVEDARELVSLQSTTARRASALIGALESYALLGEDLTLSPVSLTDVAQQALDNLAIEIEERKAQVTITELPIIAGQEAQLVQLFQNLLQNGLKYNQSKTPTLIVRVQSTSAEKAGIVVEDNGIGISSQSLDSIFTPLERLCTVDKYEGTGLGLAICKKIVLRHGGDIWCTSTENIGTTFHLTFPAIHAHKSFVPS